MRRGEILGLQRDCVRFDSKTIIVRRIYSEHAKKIKETTKGRSIRTVPISESLCQTMAEHLSKHSFDLVFSKDNGLPITPSTLRHHFKNACAKAGVREIKFHSIRATSGTILLMKGANPYAVQRRLGHADFKTTELYLNLSSEFVGQQAELMSFKTPQRFCNDAGLLQETPLYKTPSISLNKAEYAEMREQLSWYTEAPVELL